MYLCIHVPAFLVCLHDGHIQAAVIGTLYKQLPIKQYANDRDLNKIPKMTLQGKRLSYSEHVIGVPAFYGLH